MTEINMDIPESRWTREALIESEKRYRRLLDNSPDIIFRMSLPDRKFEYISPATEQLTGYTPEDFYSYSGLVEKLIHPDWKEYFNKQWETLLAGKIPPFYEYQAIDRAGITRWFHQRNMLVKDESGHPVALEGIISDISARRQAEEALQKSEGKLNAMLQSVADPMSMMDKDLNIIWANETAREYFGEDLVGRKCYEAYHQRQNPCEPDPCITLRSFQDKGIHRHETTVIDALGNTHIFDCTANVALNDENDKPVAVLEISRDITEQKAADKELKESWGRSRSIVGALPGIIFLFSADGRFIDCQFNESELLLLQPDQVIGKHVAEILPPSLANLTERKIRDTLESGQVQTFEYQLTLNNEERYFEARMINYEAKSVLALVLDITERRLALNALKNEQEFTQLLLDTSPAFIVALGVDGRTIMMNKALTDALEYTPEEVRGASYLTTFVPEEDRELVGQVFREIVGEDKITINENRLVSKSGKIFLVEWRGRPMKHVDHPLDFFVGVGIDITEQKKAEEALRNSERDFRSIIENISDGFYRVNIQGRLSMVSPSGARIFGYNHPDDVMGLSLDGFWVQPGQRNDLIRMMQANGSVSDYEIMARKKDGTAFPVAISCTYFKDENGSIQGYEGIVRDITERKRTEQAMRRSKIFLDSVIDSIPALVFLKDARELRFARVNRSVEELTGYGRDDLLGKNDYDFVPKEQADFFVNKDRQVLSEKKIVEIPEELLQTRDKGVRTLQTWKVPLMDERGEPEYLLGISVDITERKLAEEALRQANKNLNLLSGITRHDINNQLTVLRGYLTILGKEQPDSSDMEYYQKAGIAAGRISELIRFTKEYEEIGVNTPVWHDGRTLVDTAAKQAPPGNVMVKNDLPADAEVFADPLIVKVFYNLMDNAMRHGGKITTIRFFSKDMDGEMVIVCEDDGDGIPEVDKEKIFDKGYGKNTGMGLFLSREILLITSITIRETGVQGKGARFEMKVPNVAWRGTSNPENRQ